MPPDPAPGGGLPPGLEPLRFAVHLAEAAAAACRDAARVVEHSAEDRAASRAWAGEEWRGATRAACESDLLRLDWAAAGLADRLRLTAAAVDRAAEHAARENASRREARLAWSRVEAGGG